MKSLKITIIGILFFALQGVNAQSINLQKGPAPKLVDPITNCQLRYYYYPNLEAYHDVKENKYYYTQNGKWIIADEIPAGYRGYSLYNKVKVAITDYDDDNPTQFLKLHKKQYPYAANGKIKNMMATSE